MIYKAFPIKREEIKQFILLSLMTFFVCSIYTILRNVKETLIITQPELGVAAIPFLKTWVLLPFMIFLVKIYTWMSNKWPQPFVFYSILTFFIGYFCLFGLILYPNISFFQSDRLAEWFSYYAPASLHPLGEVLRFWVLSSFYCISEGWGSLVVLMLVWGTINRSTNLEEAKRFYGPMALITNLSGIFASQLALFISHSTPNQLWNITVLHLIAAICAMTFLLMVIYYFLDKTRLNTAPCREQKKKQKLFPIVVSFFKNHAARPLILMVIFYFFVTGIMELIWKYYLQQAYPHPHEFNDFLNKMTIIISILSVAGNLVVSSLLRKFAWMTTAMLTPLLLLPPLFYLFVYFWLPHSPTELLTTFTIVGAIYFALNRACKFTAFDLSKEIACVSFPQNEQANLKGVVDGISPKIGKAAEAIVLQGLMMIFGTFSTVLPILLVLMMGVHLLWASTLRYKTEKEMALE